jgi:D-alanyl-D-alanine carboxypeptidase (penicillin-binding protein 5/6)
MSLLLIGEAIRDGKISVQDEVTTSEHAASMGGSQIYLEPGEKMTANDLLKAIVIGSANDAVVAMAEHIAGSETAFVSMMNAKAAELGMADTTFVNASGLDAPGHVTSAYDIALMSRALLLEYPDIKKYTTIWMDSVRRGEFQLANTNKLIRTYTGATGLKTGSTSVAGCCLAASAERDGMELICGVLGSPTSKDRFAAAKSLLDYGFANYALVEVFPKEALLPVPVKLGVCPDVQPILSGDNHLVVDKGLEKKLERTIEVAEKVDAPVAANQKLGEMIVTSEGSEIARIPIVAGDNVNRIGFGGMYGKLFKSLLMSK